VTSKQIDIAIVGAASLAGEAVLSLLAERKFPVGKLYAVDLVEQSGSHVEFKDEPVVIHELADFDFSVVQLAIFLLDGPKAVEYAPKATQSGCIVIDSSIGFRYEDDVPLIIPGLNDELIGDYRERMILSIPSSAAYQLIKILEPIHQAVGANEVTVCVMQPVSEQGKPGQEELGRQTAQLLNFQNADKQVYPSQIAFNTILHSGILLEGGYTSDELDIVKATHKILNNDKISISPTVVTVPVFFGNSSIVQIGTQEPLGADKAAEILDNIPGVRLTQTTQTQPMTPVDNASGKSELVVSRIRNSISGDEKYLNLCSVVDNIQGGVALNSVQTAEILVKDYL